MQPMVLFSFIDISRTTAQGKSSVFRVICKHAYTEKGELGRKEVFILMVSI